MKSTIEFALLSTLFLTAVNAQATCQQWYVHLGASLALFDQDTSYPGSFRPFAPCIRLSIETQILKKGTLKRDVHSAAEICCKNGNQDLSASCWSQCSSCQQQLAEDGCHILPPTPTSSVAPQGAPALTTSWGPGQPFPKKG